MYIPLLRYIIIAGESRNSEGFLKILAEESISEYRGDTMTIAEHLENKGAYKKQIKIACTLLAMGMPRDDVARITELPTLEIENLQAA